LPDVYEPGLAEDARQEPLEVPADGFESPDEGHDEASPARVGRTEVTDGELPAGSQDAASLPYGEPLLIGRQDRQDEARQDAVE
jgi:hypothetical protein